MISQEVSSKNSWWISPLSSESCESTTGSRGFTKHNQNREDRTFTGDPSFPSPPRPNPRLSVPHHSHLPGQSPLLDSRRTPCYPVRGQGPRTAISPSTECRPAGRNDKSRRAHDGRRARICGDGGSAAGDIGRGYWGVTVPYHLCGEPESGQGRGVGDARAASVSTVDLKGEHLERERVVTDLDPVSRSTRKAWSGTGTNTPYSSSTRTSRW